jgi:cardiolipin synthase
MKLERTRRDLTGRLGKGGAIALLAGTVVVALLLVAQDQQTLRVRSDVAASDAQHAAYVAAIVGADLTRGNRYDVLTNGDQIFPPMLEAIAGAKTRIVLETYIYDSGQVAEQFTAALESAARRGVLCRIVVDSVGSSGMDEGHARRLERAGCDIAEFSPPHWYTLEELNYRSHRKLLVVDGAVGFTGGVGFADHWRGNAQDREHWRDTMIQLRGPVVRLLEAAFYENFMEVRGPVSPALDDATWADSPEGHSLVVRSSPSGGSNALKQLYLLALASARQTADITSPYFVTDESTMWSIEDAVSRGVRIRLLVEGEITDAKPVKYASRASYDHLLQLGVEIYEYQPTMLHAKAMVVDGVFCIFGSANFDNRSFELNDELNVAVSSRLLASRLLADMHGDLRRSKRLTLDAWRQRGWLEKVREHFWSYFGEVF